MDFGDALRALKQGKRVARAGWNGKGMWLFLTGPDNIEMRSLGPLRTAEYAIAPSICMKTVQDTIVVGWLASQTDMLAEDWVVVE